jgi:hypothetical protein
MRQTHRVKRFLHTHPGDGPDFPIDERAATGWNNATNHHDTDDIQRESDIGIQPDRL